MTALVDTSLLTGAARPSPGEPWVVSIVTVGELETGVLLAREDGPRASRLRRLTELVAEVPIVAIDRSVAARYAELRAATTRRPSNDLWIAATALAHDLTLLTADEQLAGTPLIRVRLITESG